MGEATEKPILFKPEMVRAILEGRKTQTRRLVKPPPDSNINPVYFEEHGFWQWATKESRRMPKYHVGDRLWVKERFGISGNGIFFSNFNDGGIKIAWRSPLFLKKAEARLWLEVTAVRCERLNDISEDDAKAEGAMFHDGRPVGHHGWRHVYSDVFPTAKHSFAWLWESIHGKGAWALNPWVWVYEFPEVSR